MEPAGFGGASRAKGDMQRSFLKQSRSSHCWVFFLQRKGYRWSCQAVAAADWDRMKLSVVEEKLRLVFLWYFLACEERGLLRVLIEADGCFREGRRANVGRWKWRQRLQWKIQTLTLVFLYAGPQEWRWGVMGLVDASVMAVLNARINYGYCWERRAEGYSDFWEHLFLGPSPVFAGFQSFSSTASVCFGTPGHR